MIPDINDILDFENGEMSDERLLVFFASLVKSGTAWTLQGFYGRTAKALIDAGLISSDGRVLRNIESEE